MHTPQWRTECLAPSAIFTFSPPLHLTNSPFISKRFTPTYRKAKSTSNKPLSAFGKSAPTPHFLICRTPKIRPKIPRKIAFSKHLKNNVLQTSKIQGTYFKISALYFKIYALCFLLQAMCFFRALEEHEKMSGKSGLSKHKKSAEYACALRAAHILRT